METHGCGQRKSRVLDHYKENSLVLLKALMTIVSENIVVESASLYLIVFKAVEMYPSFSEANLNQEYQKALDSILDCGAFDVNRAMEEGGRYLISEFPNP